MGLAVVIGTVTAFALLTAGYVKGIRFVGKNAPDRLVTFHFIFVTMRFLFAVTAVGIFAFLSDDRAKTIQFAAMVLTLYIMMIVVTLIIKK